MVLVIASDIYVLMLCVRLCFPGWCQGATRQNWDIKSANQNATLLSVNMCFSPTPPAFPLAHGLAELSSCISLDNEFQKHMTTLHVVRGPQHWRRFCGILQTYLAALTSPKKKRSVRIGNDAESHGMKDPHEH
jgi:hypothetical protein